MKKTLVAVAVLGAFAGSAVAADVTVYGVVDTGFSYTHADADIPGTDAVNKFEMKSGQQAGSRFGLKGAEEIGNGVKVGFVLESGFNSDTGTFRTSDTLFDREASLWVQGGFGKIAAGRIGSINQGVSSWGKVGMLSAFGTSYGNYVAQIGNTFSVSQVWDNMIAYESPDFAGFKVYAQYAMGENDHENKSSSDRYYAIGATYNNGPLAGYLAVDSINYKTYDSTYGAYGNKVDDSLTVTLGGSYDFDVVKVFFGGQYFDEVTLKSIGGVTSAGLGEASVWDVIKSAHANHIDGVINENGKQSELEKAKMNLFKLKGYALNASASAPVAGGTALFGVGYVDAEAADSISGNVGLKPEFTRWSVSVGYTYNLSKRTNVYGVASYMRDKLKFPIAGEVEPSATSVLVGLRHNF